MSKFLIVLLVLVVVGALLAVFNFYRLDSSANGAVYNPDSPVLRTPDSRFAALTDFPFEPHYTEIEDPDLGSLRVHYLDEGPRDGEIIVLLHGQATWSYSFRKFIPALTAAGYRTIVPDLIGFGRSDKPSDWKAHSFEKHVFWLKETLNALNIRNAHAFMFDWGGYFGLRVMADDPDIFSDVVLCTTTMPQGKGVTGMLWVTGWRNYIYSPEVFPISGMVQDMTQNEMDAQTVAGLDAPYPDETYKGGPRRFPMMIPASFLHPAAGPNREAWEKLASWDKPAVTVVSESLAQRGFNPKEFHDQLPGTQGQPHQVYPDTGFFLIEDAPEAMVQKTLEFLQANN
jgi:haloalkane dehalogenase